MSSRSLAACFRRLPCHNFSRSQVGYPGSGRTRFSAEFQRLCLLPVGEIASRVSCLNSLVQAVGVHYAPCEPCGSCRSRRSLRFALAWRPATGYRHPICSPGGGVPLKEPGGGVPFKEFGQCRAFPFGGLCQERIERVGVPRFSPLPCKRSCAGPRRASRLSAFRVPFAKSSALIHPIWRLCRNSGNWNSWSV